MKNKLYEFLMADNEMKNILAKDYGTHISLVEIEDKDINNIFGKAILVTSEPSTIEDEIKYFIENMRCYASKVVSYKLLEEQ